ncbi:MAG: magnesium chelatase [Saprospirales bacterium]|nr:MAG: magnesium chelatase [Saprospirales bacterium]
MTQKKATTLGELKSQNYAPKSIKQEIKDNLIHHIKNKTNVFYDIFGYDETVIPDIEKALLAKHNFLLLGLRGQAKTRVARNIVRLLDNEIPIIKGSEINDNPLNPISYYGKKMIAEHGDNCLIDWISAEDRYVEKLATPDVSVSDLIGDLDPIKAVNLKLSYSDEQAIHFGLVPRSHRSIFVLNELPDLQPRIQVALFNILEEGDIQIRGFKLRLPLDILFIFTANPEDYTNRGSIITPLKDRIESQITTHYPHEIEISKMITKNEAKIDSDLLSKIYIPELAEDLLEYIAFNARESEFIDESSGVSARMTIASRELIFGAAERRLLLNNEATTSIRFSDFWSIIPAITGKVELLYEGENLGPHEVALNIMSEAVKELYLEYFPNPNKKIPLNYQELYTSIKSWFETGNSLELKNDEPDKLRVDKLKSVKGLNEFVEYHNFDAKDIPFIKELTLHALTEFEQISKEIIAGRIMFKDPLAGMLDNLDDED